MRKLLLLALPALATVAVAAPARASTTTVHLDVDVATAAPLADCDVTVPSGSNGLAVLDAAVSIGCIDSYRTETHAQFGEFVTCINDLCGAPDAALNLTYWAIYVDGSYASKGVTSLSLPSDGTALAFSYETWATYLVPAP